MNKCDFKLEGLESTQTVTLLLACVEESVRLPEFQPEEMIAALAQLSQELTDTIAAHNGVRIAEHGGGDKFVAAFAHASDAVACAVELQQASLVPVQLRIGIDTGEVASFFTGSTMHHAAQLCDFAEGGQTVISGATEELVHGRLPERAWLMNLGAQTLHHRARLERVVQVCHPDTRTATQRVAITATKEFCRSSQVTSSAGTFFRSRLASALRD